jgi:hypothetical protein
MADDMTAIVQRMIDAGESEENIGSVIQHYKKAYTPDPTMQAETARAIGRSQGLGFGASRPPVTDELGRPQKSTEPDTFIGGFAKSIKDQILNATVNNPALEAAARPQSASDLTALMLLNSPGALTGAVKGAKDAARAIPKALAKIPVDALDADLVSIASPRAGAAIRKAQQVQAVLSKGAIAAPAVSEIPAAVDVGQAAADARAARAARFGTQTATLTPEQLAAQSASGHGVPPAASPAPAISGPQGVADAATTADASARAATIRAATAATADPAAAFAARFNTVPDVDAVKALVAKGVPPSAAVKAIAGANPTKFGSLMTLYLRSRQVK